LLYTIAAHRVFAPACDRNRRRGEIADASIRKNFSVRSENSYDLRLTQTQSACQLIMRLNCVAAAFCGMIHSSSRVPILNPVCALCEQAHQTYDEILSNRAIHALIGHQSKHD
jgi:hypothetical protein